MRRVTFHLLVGVFLLATLSCSDSTSPDTKVTVVDISGSWSLEELTDLPACALGAGELPGQSYQGWMVTITQDGVQATISADDASGDFAGKLTGNKLIFTIEYQDPQFRRTESYDMTVAADRSTMSGTSQWTTQETGQPLCSGTRQVIMQRNVNKNCTAIAGTWVMDKVSCSSCPFQTLDVTLVTQMTGCFFSGTCTFKLDGSGGVDPGLFGTVNDGDVYFLWSARVYSGQEYMEYLWEFDLQALSSTQMSGTVRVPAASYEEFVIFRKQ